MKFQVHVHHTLNRIETWEIEAESKEDAEEAYYNYEGEVGETFEEIQESYILYTEGV